MQYFIGTFTRGSTGTATISVPFEPEGLQFTVSRKSSGAENGTSHLSIGKSNNDGSTQKTHCIFDDGGTNAPYTQYYDQYCVAHLARSGGSISRVLSASYDGYNAGTGTIDLDFDAADANYQITMELWG